MHTCCSRLIFNPYINAILSNSILLTNTSNNPFGWTIDQDIILAQSNRHDGCYSTFIFNVSWFMNYGLLDTWLRLQHTWCSKMIDDLAKVKLRSKFTFAERLQPMGCKALVSATFHEFWHHRKWMCDGLWEWCSPADGLIKGWESWSLCPTDDKLLQWTAQVPWSMGIIISSVTML